jgi:hypothetical protein
MSRIQVSRIMLAVGAIVGAMVLASPSPLRAADLLAPARVAQAQCGPCGCLTVTYVYHRELRSTYGAGFDPRNFDTTQPHYYFGPMRAYPRYFVDGAPVSGSCQD